MLRDELKLTVLSPPRRLHRPCSTQNDRIGIFPLRAGRITSYGSVLSCLPPLRISPDWM